MPRSQQGWRVTLGAGMLDRGELPVSPSAAELLGSRREFLMRVRHDGQPAAGQMVEYDHEARLLSGIEWPFGFYPGIYVTSQVERRGEVVVARTERLSEPPNLDGDELLFAGDLDVYKRWKALDAGHPIARARRSSQSLRDLIAIAFTTRGLPHDQGASG